MSYSSSGDSTMTCTPRVEGRQLITCARSIFVSSLPAACQSFTQKVRVGPWTAKVDPSIITGTGSATVPARNVSSNSGIYGLNFSNWTSTALSAISAGGSSTGSSDSSRSRVSVCSFRFLTIGINLNRLRNRIRLQTLLQMLRQISNFDPLLLPRVAVSHRDCFIFERLVIDGDAKRSSDLILARVEFSDAAGVVLHSTQHRLQRSLDRLRHSHDLRFVLRERQDRSFDRRELRAQFQNNSGLALIIRLFRVSVHQHRQHRSVDTRRRLDDVRIKTLLRRLVEVRQILSRI